MPEMPFSDPLLWFEQWLADARERGILEPNAMSLATVSATGQPSVRIVLLKEVDRKGFVFYTNTLSQKGQDLTHTARAGLNFYWREFARQVRIEGTVETVGAARADAYFAERPRDSQIGAWASMQTRHLNSRQTLLERVDHYNRKFEGMDVPRPPHWSGYCVVALRMEFWEAGDFRLHDRFEFVREDVEQEWVASRLHP